MELKEKGSSAQVGEFDQLKVDLSWTSAVDLDLMAFYKTEDGRTGGVYSENYSGGSLGNLNRFPHIQLSGDEGVGAAGGRNVETMRITKLDEIEELYICALNFTAASKGNQTSFANYDAEVEVHTDRDENMTVPLQASQSGTVAVIAKFTSSFMGSELVNDNEVMSFDAFKSQVPGAEELELSSKVTLKSKGDSFELKSKAGSGDEFLINLNWSQQGRRAIDLDLGALYDLHEDRIPSGGFLDKLTGSQARPKGAIQALGNTMGRYNKPPYIEHLGDDRTGSVSEGEFIRINSEHIDKIDRILVYAFIYEGVRNWSQADAVVSVEVPGQPEVEVAIDNHRDGEIMCAIASLHGTGDGLRIEKQIEYFNGQEQMDRFYNWGLQWAAGRK